MASNSQDSHPPRDANFFHCITRCVRHASLWGFDTYAGRDCSHRKQWILDQLRLQAEAFAIDVCAYAVLPNHYELVLHVDRQRVQRWNDTQIIEQWRRRYTTGPRTPGQQSHAADLRSDATPTQIEVLRSRLCDVSWYMRCINQRLSRRANLEDGCTGTFWERGSATHSLNDTHQLLVAMAHVDLGALRAGIAATFEDSQLTSLTDRLQAFTGRAVCRVSESVVDTLGERALLPFADSRPRRPPCAPWRSEDYLELLHWTSRAFGSSQRRFITATLPPLLQRVHIAPDAWHAAMRMPSRGFSRVLKRVRSCAPEWQPIGAGFDDLH